MGAKIIAVSFFLMLMVLCRGLYVVYKPIPQTKSENTQNIGQNINFRFPSPSPSSPANPYAGSIKIDGATIFNLVNQYRAANGKPFLSVSDELCKLAKIRSDFLISNEMEAIKTTKTGAHTGLRNQINSQTYSGKFVDEDIAGNPVSNMDALDIWKKSPSHNLSILSNEYVDPDDGTKYDATKACVAVSQKYYYKDQPSTIVVLLKGDK